MANPIGVLPLVTRAHRLYLALAAILIVAAALRGWNLNSGGVMIPYYLAGVRSQVASWHNVFFNAFDPAGFVSLDKPPIAFWLQDASAKLFGFSTASVMLPQVLTELALLLDKLKFVLPAQPEPKISAAQTAPPSPV
jgi:4-amino-4-deoxy-L-arabinose transferase-like glycosyltransferase